MSYLGISIREAMEKINHVSNGWYLPQVQRQYVWGARHGSETYICLLLDSLYRRYPIGGLVLWETDNSVPYREFLNDYSFISFEKQVDSGRWGCHKSLVYDGQQRLQTLRSVLYYTFNGRILCFNLLVDKDNGEPDETGFFFIDQGKEIPLHCIKMTQLSSIYCDPKEKVKLETSYTRDQGLNENQELIIRTNLGALWDVFVDRNVKSIAYFSVVTDNDDEVNEVFRRLNTGGVALTQIELVLSKIKADYPDFEEKLWEISDEIKQRSGGFIFTSTEILQYFYLLVFGTIKVDESRVDAKHILVFAQTLKLAGPALLEFFKGYLWEQLKINNGCIVERRQAMLPIAVYLSNLKENNHSYEIKRLSADNLKAIHQYFILSQFCDWNTQTMVNAFSDAAKKAGVDGQDFPVDSIKQIAIEKRRVDILFYHQFISQPWLALKILTPNRYYVFHESKPQVDHIFPLKLADMENDYESRVDILWNLQPMPAGVNNYKRVRHPVEFFNSTDGKKYFEDYDFMPALSTNRWDDERKFLRYRHKKMRIELLKRYGLKLKRLRTK